LRFTGKVHLVTALTEFVGRVTRRRFGAGTKSEHEAVYLDTDHGSFLLRRAGGNPFSDPEIESLVGKRIRCRGEAFDYFIVMTEWSTEPDDSGHSADD
jgi:hypothetical protein